MMKQIIGRSPVSRTLKGNKKWFKIAGVRVNGSLLNSQLASLVIINDSSLIFQYFSIQYNANKTYGQKLQQSPFPCNNDKTVL